MTTKIAEALGLPSLPLGAGVTGSPGQYVSAAGYPVTWAGRPDWCGRCSGLETERARHDPGHRPERLAYELPRRGASDRGTLVPLGYCRSCLDFLKARENRNREHALSSRLGRQ